LESAGWTCLPSDANFFCARMPVDDLAAELQRLRTHHGIKLRDATSFGLPGHVRLGVLPSEAQDALLSVQLTAKHEARSFSPSTLKSKQGVNP
jgi:histidinol-phosphate/aromatic aminotransferase/cobyric acid decarboxylase-like protein